MNPRQTNVRLCSNQQRIQMILWVSFLHWIKLRHEFSISARNSGDPIYSVIKKISIKIKLVIANGYFPSLRIAQKVFRTLVKRYNISRWHKSNVTILGTDLRAEQTTLKLISFDKPQRKTRSRKRFVVRRNQFTEPRMTVWTSYSVIWHI